MVKKKTALRKTTILSTSLTARPEINVSSYFDFLLYRKLYIRLKILLNRLS